ncbi:MAG: family 43 glycosylhydrolase [Prolixibacteraceae bacterium]|nr:family 43 glycosylhydrolase [Prolixibacteraceae bacterium]
MRISVIILLAILTLVSCNNKKESTASIEKTFCNPLNISYRFCLDEPSRREAADPTMVVYKDKYFLFASKSGGYWYSDDLLNWTFIETNEIPVEEYAPTVVAVDDILYFLASSNEKSTVYKTGDPFSGKWQVAVESLEIPVWDPALFLDDDKKMYLYWGCSNKNPLYGVEVDYKNNFSFIGKPVELKYPEPEKFGWEVPGDFNTLKGQSPWIEGAWVNKHNGKYYLQYAGPGTEYKSYSDGVYVSENPLGPYTVSAHNPFSYKPEGFISGAGHGSTFKDKYGNYWHIGTITISVKHMFERRLALFPTFIDESGLLYTSTEFGDYPTIIPQRKIEKPENIFKGWMLLSYNKEVEVSSSIDSFPPENITDEDIRTHWSAQSGSKDEWALIDLGETSDVYSLQINFAEEGTRIFGRQKDLYHRYTIECSDDKVNWKMLADKSENMTDNTHEYIQLDEKVSCRYIRIKNVQVPGGNFAISGLRVFGKGKGASPSEPGSFSVIRNKDDKRCVSLSWDKTEGADGYNISFGTKENKLYSSYIVYGDTSLEIRSLNTDMPYYFSIEAFNENGISKGSSILKTE